jgi:hypothetical protein
MLDFLERRFKKQTISKKVYVAKGHVPPQEFEYQSQFL